MFANKFIREDFHVFKLYKMAPSAYKINSMISLLPGFDLITKIVARGDFIVAEIFLWLDPCHEAIVDRSVIQNKIIDRITSVALGNGECIS
jgi:hypothetical protein